MLPLHANTCCCDTCSTACLFVNDDFSTDTSGDYANISGTKTVSSGTLSSSSTDGIFIHECPYGVNRGTASASFRCNANGVKFRLIGAFTDDENYLYAEVERVGEGAANLKIFKVENGDPPAQIAGLTFGALAVTMTSFQTVALCWNETQVVASFGNRIIGANDSLGGTKAGIGGNGNNWEVTLFRMTRDTTDAPNGCQACEWCVNVTSGTMTSQALVELTGITGSMVDGCDDCTVLNDAFFLDLTQLIAASPIAHNCQWQATITLADCYLNELIEYEVSSGALALRIYDPSGDTRLVWTKAVATPLNGGTVRTTFTPGFTDGCDHSGSTVNVTPL